MRAVPDEDGFLDVGNLDKDLETIFSAEKETIFSDPIYVFRYERHCAHGCVNLAKCFLMVSPK